MPYASDTLEITLLGDYGFDHSYEDEGYLEDDDFEDDFDDFEDDEFLDDDFEEESYDEYDEESLYDLDESDEDYDDYDWLS